MNERDEPVHVQLLSLAKQAFHKPETKSGFNGQTAWMSHPDWRPRLMISRTKWIPNAKTASLELVSSALIMRDTELLVDGEIKEDYLNDPQGLEFLSEYKRYFAEPKNIILRGLVAVINPGFNEASNDGFTSSPSDADIFKSAKV